MSTPNYSGLPSPNGLEFNQWANVAVEQLSDYGLPVPPTDESLWQLWATNFVNGSIPGCLAPEPYGFADWQQWASAVVGTLA